MYLSHFLQDRHDHKPPVIEPKPMTFKYQSLYVMFLLCVFSPMLLGATPPNNKTSDEKPIALRIDPKAKYEAKVSIVMRASMMDQDPEVTFVDIGFMLEPEILKTEQII